MTRIRLNVVVVVVLVAMAVVRGQNTTTAAPPAPAISPATSPAGAPEATPRPMLPPGHPSLGDMLGGGGSATRNGADEGGTTRARLSGTLNIAVIAGSANPTSTAGNAVTVTLLREGMPPKAMELKTDEAGKLTVADIPLMPPVEVVVAIHHAGLSQQAEPPPLTPETPERSLTLKVFEPTVETPPWTVAMRHVFVEYTPDKKGAKVMEMLQVQNPADRAWIGTKAPGGLIGAPERRTTITLTLPTEASDVEWGGAFDESDTRMEGERVVTGSALFPGESEFQVSYTVPVKGGTVELPIVAPVAVGNLILIVPADETRVTAAGLEGGTKVDMGEGRGSVRMYRAANLAAGTTTAVAIRGIGGSGALRNVLIGAAFLLVVAGAGLMLMRKPKAKK